MLANQDAGHVARRNTGAAGRGRCSPVPASAQSGEPIKIGFSMALTGALAPNGKSALLAQKIWEEDINAKGGLLGRPVKLVYYDDQSNAVDGAGHLHQAARRRQGRAHRRAAMRPRMIAPAMPIVMQKKKMFIGLFGLAVNTEFKYPNYFSMIPSGPDAEAVLHQGLLRACDEAEPEAADGRDRGGGRGVLPQCLRWRARECQEGEPASVVYDRTLSAVDRPTSRRSCARSQATNPDLVVVCSYPPDSVGIVRAVNEIGFKPKMIGGAMVGLQAPRSRPSSVRCSTAGSTTTSGCRCRRWNSPALTISSRSTRRAPAPKASIRSATTWRRWGYAQLQVLEQAVEATKSLDDAKLGDYIRTNTFKTVVGDVKFGQDGEWAKSRVLQVQFQNVKGNDVAQFKDMTTQVVVDAGRVRIRQADLSVREGEVSAGLVLRGASHQVGQTVSSELRCDAPQHEADRPVRADYSPR